VKQGEAVKRPSWLELTVDTERRVFVGGDVIELGRGSISI
jgi:predicted PhzF superfamily epimerase YddE/YHI9